MRIYPLTRLPILDSKPRHHIPAFAAWLLSLTLLILALPLHMAAADDLSAKGEQLFMECEKATSSRQYNLLKKKAEELRRIGQSQNNRNEEIVGEALRLHALISVRDTTEFALSIEALIKDAPTIKKSSPRLYAAVARTISSYYQRIINDYSQALHYATEYLDATRQAGDRNLEAAALSSIASIYFQKQDNSGWSYAVESYELAKKSGDLSTRYITSCNMANFLFNTAKFEEAMTHLKEAEDFARRAGFDAESSYINSFFGDIYDQLGNTAEAEKYYKLSLEATPETSNYDIIYSRVCYAMFLLNHDRLNEALAQLQDTDKLAREKKVTIFNKEIFFFMSKIYEKQGNYAKSLEFYIKYADAKLELFSEQKEREFAILDLRNKVSEEERKNASQSLELMKRGRTIIILSAVGTIFLIICVAGLFYHRNKMNDYKQIMARYLANAESERHLREQLEAAKATNAEAKTGAVLNDEKSQNLFEQLEKMMKDDRTYRDASLSLDKTATLLSTNRTYLSHVVNEKAGKSFSNYVNEYRLNEAVEILSDPDNDEPLKNISASVGFTSPSNFYMLFRQKVGVSPSIFRTNVKNIKKTI